MEGIDNPRLARLKGKTLAWRFDITYVPGKDNGGPDCLSRRGFEREKVPDDATVQIHEIKSESISNMWDKEARMGIHMAMLQEGESFTIDEIDDLDCVVASVRLDLKPITWEEIMTISKSDLDIQLAINYIRSGSTGPTQKLTEEATRLVRLRKDMEVEVDMLVYRGRPVVPKLLRKRVIKLLHSAHQGITRMTSRAEDAVFWPGMTGDIKKVRLNCESCDRYAPSQSNLPPIDPIVPEYPFQHLSADYMEYAGYSYGIVVDRFSNWFKLYQGKGGAMLR